MTRISFETLLLNQRLTRRNTSLLDSLRQRKFMSAFRAPGHFTVYRRRTTRTSKRPTIHYIEGKPTFRTIHNMLQLRSHSLLSSSAQQLNQILKTFLKILYQFNAEFLTTSKTIKYRESTHSKNRLTRTR
jgi:hypothetical protein